MINPQFEAYMKQYQKGELEISNNDQQVHKIVQNILENTGDEYSKTKNLKFLEKVVSDLHPKSEPKVSSEGYRIAPVYKTS